MNFKLLSIRFFIFTALSFLTLPLFGQFHHGDCGTDHYHEQKMKNDAKYREEFLQYQEEMARNMEKWLHDPEYSSWRSGNVLTIPLVFHVIHLGEDVGVGSNIPDSKIFESVQQLNDIYKNAFGTSIDMEVQFCLAQRDEQGNPTDGIDRKDGSGIAQYAQFGIRYDKPNQGAPEQLVKALSTWDNQKYYNVWVVHEIDGPWCGYAYFPSTSSVDGTVVDDDCILGTTMAHEIGHALNLFHTFNGDTYGCPPNANCSVQGDAVCDTPPHRKDDCGGTNPCSGAGIWDNSLLNYMSYCGGTSRFTQGQKDRLRLALTSAPRKALLGSDACLATSLVNEIGIKALLSPNEAPLCEPKITPIISVKVYGTAGLKSAEFIVHIDGVPLDTFLYTSPFTLSQNQSVNLSLGSIPVTNGPHTIEVYVYKVNNTIDEYDRNNYIIARFKYDGELQIPVCMDFETDTIPDNFIFYTSNIIPDTSKIDGCPAQGNTSMVFKSFSRDNTFSGGGAISDMYLKPFDLRTSKTAQLSFSIAKKRPYKCEQYYSLKIYASKDCGNTWDELYYKNDAGNTCAVVTSEYLNTVNANLLGPPPTTAWVPSKCSDWRSDTLDLTEYVGNKVLVRFLIEVNQLGGENLYLDNICLTSCNIDPAFSFKGNDIICKGEPVKIHLEGFDSPGLTYQWRKDNLDIPNANTFQLDPTVPGGYRLVTSNGTCQIYSKEVKIREIKCDYDADGSCLDKQYIENGGRFDYHFSDQKNGFLCTDAGLIYKIRLGYGTNGKINSASNFQLMPAANINDLHGIYAVDSNFVVTVGQNGTILKLQSGSWVDAAATPKPTVNLNDVHFTSTTSGWIVGDGGNAYKANGTFALTPTQLGSNDLNGVHFTNANNGWIVGDAGAVFKTTNGGTNWTPVTVAPENFRAVYFISIDTGWVVTFDGKTFKTENNGNTWKEAQNGIFESLGDHLIAQSLTTQHLASKNYYLNYGGSTVHTYSSEGIVVNQTIGFEKSTQPAYLQLLGSLYYNNRNLEFSPILFLLELAGGQQGFEPLIGFSQPVSIEDIHFKDKLNGIAIANPGSFVITSDGGQNWKRIPMGNTAISPRQIYFKNATDGYIVGKRGLFLTTTNGGANWSAINLGTTEDLNDIFFSNSNSSYGRIVGSNSFTAFTTNGGASWTKETLLNFPLSFNSVFIRNSNEYIACDSGSLIYKDRFDNYNWKLSNVGTAKALRDMYFSDDTTGLVIGDSIATYSGGFSWVPIGAINGFYLNSTYYVSKDTGWIVGGGSTGHARILRSDNNGNTWKVYPSGDNLPMRGVGGVDKFNVWAGGDKFNIVKVSVPVITIRYDTICEGQSFKIKERIYTKTGFYVDTFASVLECDSFVRTNLFVRPNVQVKSLRYPVICQGDTVSVGIKTSTNQITSYQWSLNGAQINGANKSTYVTDKPGYYTLKVEYGGCSVLSDSVEVIVNDLPKLKISGSPFACEGQYTTLNGGDGYSKYEWSNGRKEKEVYINVSGKLILTVTDSNGCKGKDSIVVQLAKNPQPVIKGSLAICSGKESVLDAGSGYVTYKWNSGLDSTQTLLVKTAGTYYVEVVDTAGCKGSASVDVIESGTPDPDIDGFTTFCEGESTTLTIVNGVFDKYIWNTGDSTQKVTIKQPGLYKITVKTEVGCIGEDSVMVEQLEAPKPNLGSDIYICPGKSTILSPGAGFSTYNWSNGEKTPSITVTKTVLMGVVVTNDLGCAGYDTVQVTVQQLANPKIAGVLAICEGNQTVLTAEKGFDKYQWSFNGSQDTSITVSAAGSYSVTVTDKFGCTATNSVTVTESASPKPKIAGATSFCESTGTQLSPGGIFKTYTWSNGATTSNTNVNQSGTYYITVTNQAGCEGKDSITVEAVPSPKPEISGKLDFCSGGNTQLITNSGFASYLWNDVNATNGPNLNVTKGGVYIVTVTNGTNCAGFDTVTVVENQLPKPTISGVLGICEGEPTTLKAASGYVNYKWSDSTTDTVLTVTKGGSYSVTVTDTFGCVGSNSVVVNEVQKPRPKISGNQSFCEGTSTTLSVPNTFSSYLWSDGTKSETVTVKGSGTVFVTVTNSSGCFGKDSFSVQALPAPVPDITGPNAICQGNTANLKVATGFQSYKWSGGQVTDNITVSTAGVYIVTVTANNSCKGIDTFTLKVNSNPTTKIKGNIVFCEGKTSVLDAGSGFTNYTWNDNSSKQTLTVTQSGKYTVTIQDANGCLGKDSVTVNVVANPKPTITGNLSICEGKLTLLDAGSGYQSYTWSDGTSAQFLQVNKAGDYTVTVSNTLGCEGTAKVTVEVLPEPKPSISGTLKICEGEKTTLSSDATYSSYLWSTGAKTATIDVNQSGTYSLTVTNAGGCSGAASTQVTVNPKPTPVITGKLSFCQGENTTLQLSQSFSNYSWSNSSSSASIIVSTAGSYQVTVTDANGCKATAQTSVTVFNNPTPAINGNLGICDGNSTTLSVPGNFQNYSWSNGSSTAQISVKQANTYIVTVSDNNGCKGTASATVVVSSSPQVAITGKDVICEGSATTIDAGTGFSSYKWNDGTTNQTLDVFTAGVYTVTVTNTNGCSGTTSFLVSSQARPSAKIIADILDVCPGDTISLEGQGGQTFKWISDKGALGKSDSAYTYLVTSDTTNVALIASNGCGDDSTNVTIGVYEKTGNAGPDVTVLKGASITLLAENGKKYSWFGPYELSCKNCPKPVTRPEETSTFFVYITDKNGCVTLDSVNVKVEENIEDVVKIINIITPNNDGKNDKFILEGLESFPENSLTIYNRWGDLIFNSKSYDNSFDGTLDGKALPAGTYYYVLKLLPEGKVFKSSLLIVRD